MTSQPARRGRPPKVSTLGRLSTPQRGGLRPPAGYVTRNVASSIQHGGESAGDAWQIAIDSFQKSVEELLKT